MTPKAQIIALLPRLTQAELREVQTAIKATNTLSGPDIPEVEDDWLLGAIGVYLARKALIPERGSLYHVRGHKMAYKTYLKKLPGVMPFLTKLESDAGLTRRNRPMLGFLCARALADQLANQSFFSVSTMMTMIDRIPEALDASFPGYAAAGLFGVVIKGMDRQLV